MGKWSFSELVNIKVLQEMAENLYIVSGIPVAIRDRKENFVVLAGWQDICVKYHRKHPTTCKRCEFSDQYICEHLNKDSYIEYKCLNNLWDVALPIVVLGEHIATLFVGQFFYEDEVIDIDYFKKQAIEFGFDREEYISALKKIPVFSREKIKHIMEYYKGFVTTLAESSIVKLQYMESEEKLRKSEARICNLLKSMRDCVLVMDAEGVITEFYNAHNVPVAIKPETFLNRKYQETFDEELSQMVNNAIASLKNGKAAEAFDYSFKIGDKNFCYSSLLSKIYGEGDEIEGYISVVRDITNKKIYEEELLKAKIEAENANDIKNNFIANMSHELRTPINVILSAVQLFELNQKNNSDFHLSNSSTHLKSIKQNCYRLLRIINNLIDISKIDAGFMILHLINQDIVSLVEDITLSVAEYASAKELIVQFDTDVEELIMAVDPDKMERILLNLLSNAIKCTKAGGSIFVDIHDYDKSIKISIKDTGRGIPQNKLESIFQRFIQVEDSLIKSHEGSGIGLAIVKSFVEMHGGKITVLSEVGVGSEFIIELSKNQPYELSEEGSILINNNHDYVEMLNVEFSDIYF